MLDQSCKTLPAGEDGFVVKVQPVLLTLSPYITTMYKNNGRIKFSTDFPFLHMLDNTFSAYFSGFMFYAEY